jgi:anti-anti-sigma factor
MLLDIERIEAGRGFRLVGELDASNVGQLSDAINREIAGEGNLTLDLSGLAFMDSSGIQVLIRTARGLDGRGKLILEHPGELMRRLLQVVPLDKLQNVEIVDDAHG